MGGDEDTGDSVAGGRSQPAGDIRRPEPFEIAAARGRTIQDVIAPGLAVLFSGINPSLYSAAVGHHFARPGNRFWQALHLAGFTPRLLSPFEDDLALDQRLGVTNLVARATASAQELSREELREGGKALADKVARYAPGVLAVVGIDAYRIAFEQPRAMSGRQDEPLGGRPVWVLPNPSGLNAHYQLPDLAAEFRRLREAVDFPDPSPSR
jgi:TDG/mug DNA glycosylase family protein